jgi:hypothetical protein
MFLRVPVAISLAHTSSSIRPQQKTPAVGKLAVGPNPIPYFAGKASSILSSEEPFS